MTTSFEDSVAEVQRTHIKEHEMNADFDAKLARLEEAFEEVLNDETISPESRIAFLEDFLHDAQVDIDELNANAGSSTDSDDEDDGDNGDDEEDDAS